MSSIPLEPKGQELKDRIAKEIKTISQDPAWSIFELNYKSRGLKQTKLFAASSLDEAIALGKDYCRATYTRFIHVYPWLVDLAAETKAAEERGLN